MRLAFIDNIRSAMIILVLSMHSADSYSPFGNWYYSERPRLGLASLLFFGLYQSFLQAFFMALLFFIAGYFTPVSYDRKGPRGFLRDRFIRLGLPTLLYMLAIGPLTEYYLSKTWRTPDSFPRAWWGHIADGEVWGMTGPMWFCAALLIFSAVYAALRPVATGAQQGRAARTAPGDTRVLALVGCIAGTTFAVRVLLPAGASFYNLQLADFPAYIVLFAAGTCARRGDWLARLPRSLAVRWGAIALAGGVLAWPLLIAAGGALEGNLADFQSGWHWQNLGMSIWVAVICVGMSLGLLVLFRERLNTQGPLARFLSRNAFAVYLFHPPILVAIALALGSLAAPPVAKFVLLTGLSCVASFVAAEWVFRRIPVLNRIL